jgi:hypothetical protein
MLSFTTKRVFILVTKNPDQGNFCIVIKGKELASPMPLYTRPQIWRVTKASNGKNDMESYMSLIG